MRWNYKTDIKYDKINTDLIKDNKYLFKNLVIASFIEITSDVYDMNLSKFYEGDEETVNWLNNTWEKEEIQHGDSLKKYINTVWPEFDWDKHYKIFRNNYLPFCKVEYLEDSRAKEMIARMVVETGTSTLYKAIANYAKEINEPVLEDLALKISKDEVYHFEMFEKVFKKYKKEENLSKTDIIKVLYDRLKEINNEDIKIAFYAVNDDNENYEKFLENIKKLAKKHYPYKMATKMYNVPRKKNQN
jgi:rubrerythrin